LKGTCIGFLQARTQELPVKAVKQVTTALYRAVPIIVVDDHILVGRGEKGKLMADLFQFPFFETSSSELEIEE
jgi:A/G-specific adenine glycosylase